MLTIVQRWPNLLNLRHYKGHIFEGRKTRTHFTHVFVTLTLNLIQWRLNSYPVNNYKALNYSCLHFILTMIKKVA